MFFRSYRAAIYTNPTVHQLFGHLVSFRSVPRDVFSLMGGLAQFEITFAFLSVPEFGLQNMNLIHGGSITRIRQRLPRRLPDL